MDELKENVRRFIDCEPYTITHERDLEHGIHRWRIAVNREPPSEEWAMIFGDCIHNARAALDHVLWQLAGSDPADTRTQFPIFIEREKFKKFGTGAIRRLDRRGQAFAKWLQPYRRDDPVGDGLWPLQVMDAADKHKTALVGVGVVNETTFNTHVPPYTRVRHETHVALGAFEPDAVIAEGRWIAYPLDGPPHTNVEVDAEFAFGVAVDDTASGVMVIGDGEIARFLSRVESVIDAAERLF